jgi:hypothetical protein
VDLAIVIVIVLVVALVQVRRRGSRLQRPDNAPGRSRDR